MGGTRRTSENRTTTLSGVICAPSTAVTALIIAAATSLRISGVRHAFGSQATWMKGMKDVRGGVVLSSSFVGVFCPDTTLTRLAPIIPTSSRLLTARHDNVRRNSAKTFCGRHIFARRRDIAPADGDRRVSRERSARGRFYSRRLCRRTAQDEGEDHLPH